MISILVSACIEEVFIFFFSYLTLPEELKCVILANKVCVCKKLDTSISMNVIIYIYGMIESHWLDFRF